MWVDIFWGLSLTRSVRTRSRNRRLKGFENKAPRGFGQSDL